ncbi:MAG: flagellar assembly protein FliH, partial [Betaproteobacteria bacterium]|nr:flagellar assembly protein FliH [Betaproteobacteria bacterium]
ELALRGLSDQIANAVVELALVIARQVLRGEIQTTPGAILPAVREALGALPNSAHGARLLLNPADAQTVRDSLGDDLARLHARIVEDQHIAQGGCRLAASSGEIDATLETRWNAVAASIVGALARVERRPSGTERDQSDLPPEVLQ